MVHAVAIYGAFWIVMLGLKVIGGISGITFLFSPLSFGYSTIVFFILFYLLNKKFNPEKHESVSNALSYMALAPSAFIVSSALHWEGSHYCQNYFMKDGLTWPYPSDYEAGTLTLRIMNRTREECLQDPFNYFGGFESSFNGWLLFFVMLVLGLALLAATVFLFIMLKEMSVKEIISDLRAYKREAEDKVEARAKIVRGIGKTGRETVSWKGKTADVCKEKEFWGEENFIFYRANVLDIIKKEHLKKGDYLEWFSPLGEEYINSYSKHKDKYPKSEVIDQISWALSHLSKVYTEKSSATGEKREQKLTSIIKDIESL